MHTQDLKNLVAELQVYHSEMQNIECKSAEKGCPTRLYDTLSSFSNQDDGGIIIFGIDEKKDYEAVGVYDAQDLQVQVNNQCKQMSPIVRALFTVCEIDGKIIVSAEIPGVDVSERPVYYTGIGKIKGSYVRVGEADEPMTDYEIYSYEAFRRRIQDDLRPVDNGRLAMMDKAKVEEYIRKVKSDRKNLAENVSDEQILELMGVTNEGTPSLAGLLSFSVYPQGCYPQLCIVAVTVPGVQLGALGDEGERFIDNKRITGTIPDMIEQACDFVKKNMRVKTIIDSEGKRIDKPEFPSAAVREVILNALVHRDYSIHTQNVPIRLTMYRDRLEVVNPGGLYGKITIDSLGSVRPETRNSILANILEILKITENRYSGIPTIRTECKRANLPAPIFSSVRGEFKVVIKNNIYQSDIKTGENKKEHDILEFCRIPRSRAELEAFTGFSRFYTMSSIIQPLIDQGKIALTIPEKPKSKKQRYLTTDHSKRRTT